MFSDGKVLIIMIGFVCVFVLCISSLFIFKHYNGLVINKNTIKWNIWDSKN
jgi:hypothetical protein